MHAYMYTYMLALFMHVTYALVYVFPSVHIYAIRVIVKVFAYN